MQVEFGGKEHEAAIAKILAAAKAANKTAAIFCTPQPPLQIQVKLTDRYIRCSGKEEAGSGIQHGFHHHRSCCCYKLFPEGIG
jgi:hypothetical protein